MIATAHPHSSQLTAQRFPKRQATSDSLLAPCAARCTALRPLVC